MILKAIRVLKDEGVNEVLARIRMKVLFATKPKIVKSAYGVKLVGNWGDTTFRFCLTGTYGNYLSDFLKNLEENFVFFDIGANQGLYSLLASKNKYCVHTYAFEPVEKIANIMRKNLEINSCSNVTLRQEGISDTAGEIVVPFSNEHSGVTSLRKNTGMTKKNISDIIIQTITHIELEKIVSCRIQRIVAKIDVEGVEENVIRELLKCSFFDNITDIIYECDERWVSPETIKNLLTARGFSNFKIIGEEEPSKVVGDSKHYDVHVTR